MPVRFPRAVVALIALAGLAACAGDGGGGATRIYDVDHLRSGNRTLAFSRGEGMPAEIYGADPAATAAILRLPQSQGGGGFAPASGDGRGSRLVFVFASSPLDSLCSGSVSAPSAGSGEATAAWCVDDRRLSSARARGPAMAGPDAPNFERVANSMIRAMLEVRESGGRR